MGLQQAQPVDRRRFRDRQAFSTSNSRCALSLVAARRVAWSSDAIVTGTAGQLAEDIAAGRLVRLDHDGPPLTLNHAILRLREHTPSPAAKAFIEALLAGEAKAVLADAPGSAKRPARRAGNTPGRPQPTATKPRTRRDRSQRRLRRSAACSP